MSSNTSTLPQPCPVIWAPTSRWLRDQRCPLRLDAVVSDSANETLAKDEQRERRSRPLLLHEAGRLRPAGDPRPNAPSDDSGSAQRGVWGQRGRQRTAAEDALTETAAVMRQPHERWSLMPDAFTKVSLAAVDDAAPGNRFGDRWEARVARDALAAERTGVTLFRLLPGKRSPFTHRHTDAEEVYVVLSGSGRVKLDDELLDIGPLDSIRVAPATARAFEAGPDGLEFLAFGPHHPADGEPVAQRDRCRASLLGGGKRPPECGRQLLKPSRGRTGRRCVTLRSRAAKPATKGVTAR
jgi:mannose-6-phosphate isomerase-like protein (cupin superfamily)